MSGDVTAIDGTTRLLMGQVNAVLDDLSRTERPIALLGHSMATDILVRTAAERQDVGPMVLVSAFSQAIGAEGPPDMLLVTGAWEPGLRAFAGLQSRVGRAEALAWRDQVYGRSAQVQILPTGWALLTLFLGLVLIFRPLSRLLPAQELPPLHLSRRHTLARVLVPAVVAPCLTVLLRPSFLPVLVADHLMLHLLIFGGLQLALLRYLRQPLGGFSAPAFVLLLLWCVAFGFALDRYAANFWPTAERVWIIAVIVIGAVPYMLADAAVSARASVLQRIAVRAGFLGSLLLAVALDFERLFFLIMIAPVMVLFYLIFGTVGRSVARVSGPLAPGVALGLVLAWALGVSFPLFQP